MSTALADLLLATGLAAAPAPLTTPESLQHKLLPHLPPSGAFPALAAGTLVHAAGGLDAETAALTTPRLVAVPSIGTTLLGLARSWLPAFNALGPAGLTEVQLARALLAYNRAALGYAGPVAGRQLPRWELGVLLTLPVEFNATTSQWVTERAKINTWAATLTAADDAALSEAAPELSNADFPAVAAALGALPAVAALARDIKARLLGNPFREVFACIEIFRQLRSGRPPYLGAGARPADIVPVVTALVDGLTDHHLLVLSHTTAGVAVMRQCQLAFAAALSLGTLPASATAALSRLARALGVAPIGLGYHSIYAIAPTATGFEPPITAAQRTRTAGGWTYLRELALGRLLDISRSDAAAPTWATLSHPGEAVWAASTWLSVHGADSDVAADMVVGTNPTMTIDADRVAARLRVATRISQIEGGFDSTQAGDAGIVSFGIQQWAAHNGEELAVLWERLRVRAPEHFDLFFASAGLLMSRWIESEPQSAALPTDARLDTANPFGREPDPLQPVQRQTYYPLHAAFWSIAPGQAPVRLRHGKVPNLNTPAVPPFVMAQERLNFFLPGNNQRVWCARARLAALWSHDYTLLQLQQAAWRFTRIEHEARGRRFSTSPVLLFSVPSAVITTLRKKLNATAAGGVDDVQVADPTLIDAGTLLRCGSEVMRVRRKKSSDTFVVERPNPAAHAAGAIVVRVHKHGTLSQNVSTTDTTWPLSPGALYHEGQDRLRFVCESESFICTASTRDRLTMERTSPATHAAGSVVYRVDGDAILDVALGGAAADTAVTLDDADFLPSAIAATSRLLLAIDDEVVRCTSRVGSVLTVERGAEGTTRAAHAAGAVVTRVAGYAELFTSDFIAGELLDIHINAPAYATRFTDFAIERTAGDPYDASGELDSFWLHRFGVNFLVARATLITESENKVWVTNSVSRNKELLAAHDRRAESAGQLERGLSPVPGTFKGWERSR